MLYLEDENGILQLLCEVGKGVVTFETWVSMSVSL